MKLAIVGSQILVKNSVAEKLITSKIRNSRAAEICSGGAVGIDKSAEIIARQLGYIDGETLHIFLPKNKRWEPEGYKERNTLIANWCTDLLCIRSKYSKTHGSLYTYNMAKSLGKDVNYVEI